MHYLKLLQTSVNFANGAGVVCSLVTFHGTADLHTLSVKELWTVIIEEGPYNCPIDLTTARNFPTEATIDDEICYENIIKKIFCMVLEPILKDLFDQLCLNFSTKPQAHVEEVNMIVVDSDGNSNVLTIDSYNTRFWAAIWSVVFEQMWPIYCAGQFSWGFHPDLRNKVEATYPDWHQQHPHDSLSQKTAFSLILRFAATAEFNSESMAGLISRVTVLSSREAR